MELYHFYKKREGYMHLHEFDVGDTVVMDMCDETLQIESISETSVKAKVIRVSTCNVNPPKINQTCEYCIGYGSNGWRLYEGATKT